jgi:hypothetical protein
MASTDQHHEPTHGLALFHLLERRRDLVEFELTADGRMDLATTDELEDLRVGLLTVTAPWPIEPQGATDPEGIVHVDETHAAQREIAVGRGAWREVVTVLELDPVTSEYSIDLSCGNLVLVDQPSEPVASAYVSRVGLQSLRRPCCRKRRRRFRRRDLLRDSLMRGVSVVVPGIAAEDSFEMLGVHDEEMIETLGPDRPHEALGVGVRIRGPKRSLQNLGTFR